MNINHLFTSAAIAAVLAVAAPAHAQILGAHGGLGGTLGGGIGMGGVGGPMNDGVGGPMNDGVGGAFPRRGPRGLPRGARGPPDRPGPAWRSGRPGGPGGGPARA